MIFVLLGSVLDETHDEGLGYSKYDYRNKEMDNSSNGHSPKTMHIYYGDMVVKSLMIGTEEPTLQVIKTYQNTVTQDMKEKIISMYEGHDHRRYRKPYVGSVRHCRF